MKASSNAIGEKACTCRAGNLHLAGSKGDQGRKVDSSELGTVVLHGSIVHLLLSHLVIALLEYIANLAPLHHHY